MNDLFVNYKLIIIIIIIIKKILLENLFERAVYALEPAKVTPAT